MEERIVQTLARKSICVYDVSEVSKFPISENARLSLWIIPGFTFKEFIQHAFKILGSVSDVLCGIFPILNHRPAHINNRICINKGMEKTKRCSRK